MDLNRSQLARYIDHTLLKADAAEEDIRLICEQAAAHSFAAVCINPSFVRTAADILHGTDVAVCTVVGFPLGATTTNVKAAEASQAVSNGAAEIDMVINIGALKSKNYDHVRADIKAVVEAASTGIVKVIIETYYLSDQEKITACRLAAEVGAHYVKTSTGFGTSGATPEDVALMRRSIPDGMGVKAAGGIRTLEHALAMIKAGANRIGTSSGIAIIQGLGK